MPLCNSLLIRLWLCIVSAAGICYSSKPEKKRDSIEPRTFLWWNKKQLKTMTLLIYKHHLDLGCMRTQWLGDLLTFVQVKPIKGKESNSHLHPVEYIAFARMILKTIKEIYMLPRCVSNPIDTFVLKRPLKIWAFNQNWILFLRCWKEQKSYEKQ